MALQKAPTIDFWSTSLNGAINSSVTTITLNSTTNLQAPGRLIINRQDSTGANTPTSREVISFTGIAGSTVTGVTRGADNSTARSHADGSLVESAPSVGVINDLNTVLTSTGGIIASTLDEDTMSSNSATALATQQSIKAYVDRASADGWISANQTWTFSSVDDPTGVITVPSDARLKYSAGMRIKFTNGGNTIYGIITAVAETAITFLHEIDPTDNLALVLMADSAITANYYSTQKAPFGFSLETNKWQILVKPAKFLQNTPTAGVWYNVSSITIPIGGWLVEYFGSAYAEDAAATTTSVINATLSTANDSESDSEFSCGGELFGASSTIALSFPVHRRKFLSLAAKDIYYLNMRISGAGISAIRFRSASDGYGQSIIRAVCAYL
jgi:hypothetical protein